MHILDWIRGVAQRPLEELLIFMGLQPCTGVA